MKPLLALLFCGSILAGRALAAPIPETPVSDKSLCGPYPKYYKEIIWNWMQAALVDANSAKIEWEGEPACNDSGAKGEHVYGWLVKFKVNSRNRFGAYTGKQSHAALIKDDKVIKAFGFGY